MEKSFVGQSWAHGTALVNDPLLEWALREIGCRHDVDRIRKLARQQGAWANIPPKRNRRESICFSSQSRTQPNLLLKDANLCADHRLVGNQSFSALNDTPC
jgi:hypothetical protein